MVATFTYKNVPGTAASTIRDADAAPNEVDPCGDATLHRDEGSDTGAFDVFTMDDDQGHPPSAVAPALIDAVLRGLFDVRGLEEIDTEPDGLA